MVFQRRRKNKQDLYKVFYFQQIKKNFRKMKLLFVSIIAILLMTVSSQVVDSPPGNNDNEACMPSSDIGFALSEAVSYFRAQLGSSIEGAIYLLQERFNATMTKMSEQLKVSSEVSILVAEQQKEPQSEEEVVVPEVVPE